jgi:hypothetical protein
MMPKWPVTAFAGVLIDVLRALAQGDSRNTHMPAREAWRDPCSMTIGSLAT